MKQTIYLDYAAATPMDDRVVKAMQPYFSQRFYNPSASYLSAKSVSDDISSSRKSVAHWLGAKPNEIIFTAGGTEANNLAIDGIMGFYPKANLVVSAIEHESVLKPSEQFDYKIAPVNGEGLVDLSKMESLINDKTVLVSIMYANNEIGAIQPLTQITEIINKVRQNRKTKDVNLPLYFHTDACQAPNYLDLHVSRLGVDLMTLNGGKIYGPKQHGVLYVNRQVKLLPQTLGGGQEDGYRSGTENVANIIGFSKALDLAQSGRIKESKRLIEIQSHFINQLIKKIPDIRINGSIKRRLPNNVHITIPDQDNETMLMKLDENGIECASGSACNATSQHISKALLAIGLSEAETRSSLRFSMGKFTTKKDIDLVVQTIAKILE